MKHLCSEELLNLADGQRSNRLQAEHLSICAECSRELAALRTLLSGVQEFHEPKVDPDILARMADAIDARVAENERVVALPRMRRVPKWTAAIMLPIAAAALIFFLPILQRLSTDQRVLNGASISLEQDLSAGQWEIVWNGLTAGMDELALLNTVIPATEEPLDEIQHLSMDELERLLELLEGSDATFDAAELSSRRETISRA